ncbi:MAG: helix-turn-helix domain-containing protein [Mucilaginibacter sp.]
MNIPEILRHIRVKREMLKYSQEYLAARMAISQRTYSKIENNETELTIGRLIEICDILDINICVLLTIAERDPRPKACCE